MLKIVFFVFLSLILITPTALAQNDITASQQIRLTTDNLAYVDGDVITIYGKIDNVIVGLEVSLQIFFEKNQIGISQVKISQDGEFTDTITAGGPLWKNEGPITIKATYGDSSTELIVDFFKKSTGEYSSIYEVKIPKGGGTSDVNYTMKGGIVTDMELNEKNLSLMINIDTNSDGVLDIKLLRDSIDSLSDNGQDIEFIVLVYEEKSTDPIQTYFTKIETNDIYRAISIPIENGDTKIEIIGTHVVPEFGTIAMIVLAVAIVSIIAVSAKSRLSIMPRI